MLKLLTMAAIVAGSAYFPFGLLDLLEFATLLFCRMIDRENDKEGEP